MRQVAASTLDAIRTSRLPITGADDDYDELVDAIGDAELVLIGEASHGTQEFYAERARITRRLIQEHGFCAVAAEADWPDAYRVDRFVRHEGDDHDAAAALAGFERFPQWMWRNTEVVAFVEWLREHNADRPADRRAGFYGVDLYSMYGSIEAVIRVLDEIDPGAAREARRRYACFGGVLEQDGAGYARGLASGLLESCAEAALAQIREVQRLAVEAARRDGDDLVEALFSAQQNARLVRGAEEYYGSMYFGRASSWNLRDTHMVETIDQVMRHLERRIERPRIVVWEHNSHLGDARATEMGTRGELNVGQLVRERFPGRSFHVGFTTYAGEVTAAHDWGDAPRRMRVRDARPDSYEHLLHEAAAEDYLLILERGSAVATELAEARLERAIGVIYRPRTERQSHYFRASLPAQFDAIIHIDESSALQPLDPQPRWIGGEPPETFPTGL